MREGIAILETYAPIRRGSVDCIIRFSVNYRLQLKTTEAAFVHLNRFLLLPKATSILKRSCGVRGAVGVYPLLSVSMCILMISAKYEEIYPPSQSAFAE